MKSNELITYQLPGITDFFWVSNDNGKTWDRHDRVWRRVSYGLWRWQMWVTDTINLLNSVRYIIAGVFVEWTVIALVIIIVILIAVGISKS